MDHPPFGKTSETVQRSGAESARKIYTVQIKGVVFRFRKKGDRMTKRSRRDILKFGAGAAAALGFPAIVRAQSKEIVILGLWDQTGAFADVGPINDRGMKMALEERGMQILGRPIKYITRDGATQAGTSTRRTEEAVGRGRAEIGIWPPVSGLAVSGAV